MNFIEVSNQCSNNLSLSRLSISVTLPANVAVYMICAKMRMLGYAI